MKEIEIYIQTFPEEVQAKLHLLRKAIADAAPKATEKISYGIPTFYLNGNLVHFAGYKKHIGFYPSPSAMVAFQEELAMYKQAKGSVQFPLEKDLPLNLIKRMVEFRVKENLAKTSKK